MIHGYTPQRAVAPARNRLRKENRPYTVAELCDQIDRAEQRDHDRPEDWVTELRLDVRSFDMEGA